MKLLFSIAFSIAAAKDECLANGDDPLNTGETPDYGGTCWDQWVSSPRDQLTFAKFRSATIIYLAVY